MLAQRDCKLPACERRDVSQSRDFRKVCSACAKNRRLPVYVQLATMGRRRWWLWLLSLVLGVQINQVDSSPPASNTIRIGYLLRNKARAGAINVAIERAQNDGLLRDYNFRYLLYSS